MDHDGTCLFWSAASETITETGCSDASEKEGCIGLSPDRQFLQAVRGGPTATEDILVGQISRLAALDASFLYRSNRAFIPFCVLFFLIYFMNILSGSLLLLFYLFLSADPVLVPPKHHFNR